MIKLFCIPYSGGSADVYYQWKKYLKPNIELCLLETAGRGRRIMEPFYRSVKEAAEDLSVVIEKEIQGQKPYMIFGHSLGALLAYETYYELIERGCHEPKHVFFSGRRAPMEDELCPRYSQLSDREFIELVFSYGGNTKEVFENKGLVDLFLPILRADFSIAEGYRYRNKINKINCNISALNGDEDESFSTDDTAQWKIHTQRECMVKTIQGKHFFITDNAPEVSYYINSVANNYL